MLADAGLPARVAAMLADARGRRAQQAQRRVGRVAAAQARVVVLPGAAQPPR